MGYELVCKYFVRENYFLKIKILQLSKMIYSKSLTFSEHKSDNELRDIWCYLVECKLILTFRNTIKSLKV